MKEGVWGHKNNKKTLLGVKILVSQHFCCPEKLRKGSFFVN